CQVLQNGAATHRVEGMRIAPAVLLEEVAVVAGARPAVAAPWQYQLCHPALVAGLFHGNAPWQATRLESVCPELSGKLYHITFDAHCNQTFSYSADHVASGKAADVELQLPVLAHLIATHLQVLVPGSLLHRSNGGRVRHPGPGFTVEAPESHQRPQGDVEAAFALLMQFFGQCHQIEDRLGHLLTGTG